MSLFESIKWKDPISDKPLTPHIECRDPYGNPYCGTMLIEGSDVGYPVLNGVLQGTPELAFHSGDWLRAYKARPPQIPEGQNLGSVESFGFQWGWDNKPRTDADLLWRAASRFGLAPEWFKGKLVLDAGCGAGAQSAFFSDNGAAVVSVDLSEAINVAYKKLHTRKDWIGVRGDIARLPFQSQSFDFVYCEGVIQHTENSENTVRELARLVKPGGYVAATHYNLPEKWHQRLRHALYAARRERLSKWDPYRLLAYTGILALTSELPVVGYLMKKSNFVVFNPRMPDFKSTWSCTYDAFGSHSFQRHVSPDEFLGYWDRAGKFEKVYSPQNENVVLLKKL